MRTRLLTDLERSLIQKFLANRTKTPTVRSMARYARQINLQEVHGDLDLIKRFKDAYERSKSK